MPDVSVFYLLQMQSQPVRVRTDRSGVRTLCINGGMYILSQTQRSLVPMLSPFYFSSERGESLGTRLDSTYINLVFLFK